MSHFESALAEVLYREGKGGKDQGGETRYGITFACLKDIPKEIADIDHDGDIDVNDVVLVNEEIARKIYGYLWGVWGLDQIAANAIAVKLFSLAVNAYIVRATTVLQWALYDCGYDLPHSRIGNDFDGDLGPETVRAANDAQPGQLVIAMRAEWCGFCRRLAEKNPAVYGDDLAGWLKRATDRPY